MRNDLPVFDEGYCKWHRSTDHRSHTSSYSSFVVTIALTGRRQILLPIKYTHTNIVTQIIRSNLDVDVHTPTRPIPLSRLDAACTVAVTATTRQASISTTVMWNLGLIPSGNGNMAKSNNNYISVCTTASFETVSYYSSQPLLSQNGYIIFWTTLSKIIKNEPIAIISDAQHPQEISHEKIITMSVTRRYHNVETSERRSTRFSLLCSKKTRFLNQILYGDSRAGITSYHPRREADYYLLCHRFLFSSQYLGNFGIYGFTVSH